MQTCPKCRSEAIFRSRVRNRWETFRGGITGKQPFRCSKCSWRGWLLDYGPRFNDADQRTSYEAIAPKRRLNKKAIKIDPSGDQVAIPDLRALDASLTPDRMKSEWPLADNRDLSSAESAAEPADKQSET